MDETLGMVKLRTMMLRLMIMMLFLPSGGDGTTNGGGGGDYDLADVLGKSILFYEAQRSGYYRVSSDSSEYIVADIDAHRAGFPGGETQLQETKVI